MLPLVTVLLLFATSLNAQPLSVPQGQYAITNANPVPMLNSLPVQDTVPSVPQNPLQPVANPPIELTPQYPTANSNPTLFNPLQSQYQVNTPAVNPPPCNSGCGQTQQQTGGYYLASDGNYYYSQGQNANAGTGDATKASATEEVTTKAPPNRFNDAGWETDDNGNVYVGDDNSKLYLISVGSFWPFPKDYRRKRDISGPSLEQLLGFNRL